MMLQLSVEVTPSSEVDISTLQGEKNLPFSRQGVDIDGEHAR